MYWYRSWRCRSNKPVRYRIYGTGRRRDCCRTQSWVLSRFRQTGAMMLSTIPLRCCSVSTAKRRSARDQWQSNTTGGLICAQYSPGEGWVQQAVTSELPVIANRRCHKTANSHIWNWLLSGFELAFKFLGGLFSTVERQPDCAVQTAWKIKTYAFRNIALNAVQRNSGYLL